MNNVKEQFDRLTSNPDDPSEIKALIGGTEDLHIECKTISDDEIEKGLIANKQSIAYLNYGKCISSFANAEGGIVIWGLFAKEAKKSEPDLIQEERLIRNVTKVKTDFDSITGKVVSRRVLGVENRAVYADRDNDTGFVVTYIPMSDEAPHRVEGERQGSGKYYRRHGTGSYVMEHYELEETFGLRMSPKLRLLLILTPKATVNDKVESYNLKFGLKNIGRAIAKYPFVEVLEKHDLSKDAYGIDGNHGTGLPLITGTSMKYQGGISDIIHVDDSLWVDQFIAKPDNLLLLTFRMACDGFRMKRFIISQSVSHMASSGYPKIYEYDPGEDNLYEKYFIDPTGQKILLED